MSSPGLLVLDEKLRPGCRWFGAPAAAVVAAAVVAAAALQMTWSRSPDHRADSISMEPLVFDLPFARDRQVQCVQGNQNPGGSHSNSYCMYALDLVSSPGPSNVLAAAPGTVSFVRSGCPGVGKSFWSDRCNGGFGNVVRIRHSDGTQAQYAHLGRIAVQLGEHIERGEVLGTESATGQAGIPHLHFSVHRPLGSNDLGASIPFEIRFRDPDRSKAITTRDSRAFPCLVP